MAINLNRRKWLKTATLASGAMALSSRSFANSTSLRTTTNRNANSNFWEWENEYLSEIPQLKARLLANENPYGPPPKAISAIMESVKVGNRYGHEDAQKLRELLAAKEGVPVEYIMLAPGSSDLLEKVAISQFMEGGEIISADPAYMSLIKTAQAMKAEWKAIPLTDTYAHDLKAMAAAVDDRTQLVYICNPNNPTGTITSGDELWDFCSSVSKEVPVFVDEAYLAFMKEEDKKSMVGLVANGENVIVSRTFSKAYGMAGIRVGYIIALPSMLDQIRTIWRSNMSLNITALKGAIAALEDHEFVKYSIEQNTIARDYVCDQLGKMGFSFLPSQTSFVLFPISKDGPEFLKQMMDLGIGVRSFETLGKTHCRVSIGTMKEMKLFINALSQVMT